MGEPKRNLSGNAQAIQEDREINGILPREPLLLLPNFTEFNRRAKITFLHTLNRVCGISCLSVTYPHKRKVGEPVGEPNRSLEVWSPTFITYLQHEMIGLENVTF